MEKEPFGGKSGGVVLPSAFPCLPENIISGFLVLCCSEDVEFM